MIQYGGRELANAFRTVRGNTLKIAEEIPEEEYGFVPAPDTRSVGALLTHIALVSALPLDFHRDRRITTLQGYDFPAFLGRIAAEEQKPRSMAQIIELLKREG